MRWTRIVAAAICALHLSGVSARAEANGADYLIERWTEKRLKSAELVDMMENMEEEKRRDVVRAFGKVFEGRTELRNEVATVLCAIKPWTLGDAEEDVKFQRMMWDTIRDEPIWSPLFKRIDCAAANRQDFYFDSVIAPVKDFHERLCEADGRVSAREVSAVLDDVRKAIDNTREGLGDSGSQSFYPLRNATRSAMLLAHLGTIAARDGREKAANGHFADAVSLLKAEIDADRLTRTRNGWRFHTDLYGLAGIYSLFAGDHNGGRKMLDKVLKWPAVNQDTAILNGLGPSLRGNETYRGIPGDYVDPIFVERLLPGAAEDAGNECKRWRHRSYFPKHFGKTALECAINMSVEKSLYDRIQRFDTCFATMEATDWRVQFISYKASEKPDKAVLQPYRQKLQELKLGNIAEELDMLYTPSTGMVQITTHNKLSTAEIDNARAAIIENFGDVLFARKKQW